MSSPGSPTPVAAVLKFGGSSLADPARLRSVAQRIAARARLQPTVVVVSAMGKTTDQLVGAAKAICPSPPARELDMLLSTGERHTMALLAITLADLGIHAVSLSGSQAGIITDQQHGQAQVLEVRPFRIRDELTLGNVVIVGGFQGVSYKREITTLGRGGSDTTAVAIAAALGSDCEIYSDVDGVYTGDPRVIEDATRLDSLDYDEMTALARAGAKVLHTQAVEFARLKGIAIYLRATEDTGGETVVRGNPAPPSGARAIASDTVVSVRIAFRPGTERPPEMMAALAQLGLRFLRVDRRTASGLSLRNHADAELVMTRIGELCAPLHGDLDSVVVEHGALVTWVGKHADALSTRALEALAENDIVVQELLGGGGGVGVVVAERHAERTARLLHDRLVVTRG